MDRRAVIAQAGRAIAKREDVTINKAKEAAYWLTDNLISPTAPEKHSLSNVPLVRYITFEKDGCLGFCGEKQPSAGPPAIKDSLRMAKYLSTGGGLGLFKPDIALLGVMYWSHMEIGYLHQRLSTHYKAPAIFMRQSEKLRNKPKRNTIWGFHAGNFLK